MRLKAAAALLAMAATSGVAQADPPCAATFDELRTRLEQDYVGFKMAVAGRNDRIEAYRRVAEPFRREAVQAAAADCTYVLRRLVAFFDDPHVFLIEDPKLTAAEADAFRAKHETRPLPARVDGDGYGLEGSWAAPEFDVTVVPDGTGRHLAVVARSRSVAWKAGDVAARFERREDETFATLYRAADRAPLRYPAALQRDGQLLHMPPITWGRRGARGPLPFDPDRPRAPTAARIGGNAFAIGIPSLSPEHQPALQRILSDHHAEIIRTNLLVVDLRGNEGGSSHVGFLLEPYYFGAPPRPVVGPRPYPMAVSSPRIIRYFDNVRSTLPAGDERNVYNDFIRRLQAAPGRVVPVFEAPELAAQLMGSRKTPAVVHAGPRRVAFLVDRYTVSAAEALVIEARRSPRVRILGENTGGSIDYQNVAMFGFGSGSMAHILGLPTVAFSDELPERGFNRTGVPVDVRLSPMRDWLGAVAAHRW